MESKFRAFALCALGLEKVLQAEISRLGLVPSGRSPGRVFFEADAAGLFRANLCLRTAERVLIEVARYKAADFDALFEGAMAASWEDYVGREDRLVISRVRIKDSTLSAQTSVQSVVHKAAYERLCDEYGIERMPEGGTERSARVYLENDEVLIGIDSSGEGLHRRGYRQSTAEAPLKETLAAAVLFLTGWNRRIPLVDLFCGSGTLLIEAALFAMDIAPGLGRSFALEDMPVADAAAFASEREAAKARIRHDVDLSLAGSDKDENVLEAARANARLAGVADRISFRHASAEDVSPSGEVGYVLSNPPYGLRLGTPEEAEALYRELGILAPRWKGWGLGFITISRDFGRHFGRRATAEHKMMNGAEEQWLHWFPPGYEESEPRPFAEPEERPPRAEGRKPRRDHDRDEGRGTDRGGDRDRRPYPPRRDYDRGGSSERRPYAPRRDDDRGGDRDRRPYPPRRDYDREGGSERRPYAPRRDEDRGGDRERRPYPPRRDHDREGGSERRPYAPRRDDDRGGDRERRPYAPRRDDDRGGDRERRPYPPRRDDNRGGDRERRPYAPRREDSRGGDRERRPYPPRRDDDRGGERRPWPRRRPDEGARDN